MVGPKREPQRNAAFRGYIYYRFLNNYKYHFEVHLKYHTPKLCKEHGTIILVSILVPILAV